MKFSRVKTAAGEWIYSIDGHFVRLTKASFSIALHTPHLVSLGNSRNLLERKRRSLVRSDPARFTMHNTTILLLENE